MCHGTPLLRLVARQQLLVNEARAFLRLLLEAGADVKAPDEAGSAPIFRVLIPVSKASGRKQLPHLSGGTRATYPDVLLEHCGQRRPALKETLRGR
jgi:hypothetical protein